ncbi:MAG: hypothetical protein MUD08_19580 [Cytophagales bacterium]|nr:hypothetical protein [Cytophagales bacterium]
MNRHCEPRSEAEACPDVSGVGATRALGRAFCRACDNEIATPDTSGLQ